jgi:hypothetical protein
MAYGKSRKVHPFVIFTSLLINDNDEAWKLLNLNMKGAIRPCRLCNISKDMINSIQVSFNAPFRNPHYLHDLGVRSEYAYFRLLTMPKNARNWLSALDEGIIEECKMNGLYPGRNPLNDIMLWMMEHGLGDLWSMSIYDTMHTLYKGPIEQCIRFGVTCIYLLVKKVSLLTRY